MLRAPSVDSVHLVTRNDKRSAGFFQRVQTFDGLWLKPFHDVDHKHGNVRNRTATVSQADERVVARGVDEQQSR